MQKMLLNLRKSPGLAGLSLMTFGLFGLAWSYTLGARADDEIDPRLQGDERASIGAILSLHDMITDVTVESLRRRIDRARAAGAKVIVLDMDTPGGLVTSSIAIADLIRELTDITTVAWVNPTAHSGGSLVAVACDEIVMSRSSRIGDSQVIMGGPGGAMAVPEELQPKAYTPVLSDFRHSAKLNGYSEVMCEAFVLPKREVWWIENVDTGERRFVFREEKLRLVSEDSAEADTPSKTPRTSETDRAAAEAKDDDQGTPTPESESDRSAADDTTEANPPDRSLGGQRNDGRATRWQLVKSYHDPLLGSELDLTQPIVRDDMLLEMSAGEATAFGFCKAIISDRAGLMERYGLASLMSLDPTWSEELAFWLTSMYVRAFLMLIILLGAYVEFHTPGVGVPGLVALIALAIFVGAPYLTGLANFWELVVIVLGFVLLAVEVFALPGFGIAGITGIVLLLVGLLGTFVPDEPGRSFPFFMPTLQSTMEWLKQGIIAMTVALAASVAGMIMLSRYLPKTTMFRRIAPANPTPSEVMVDDDYLGVARIGDIGITEGPLRPTGKARFGSTLVDVVTQGDYLERGQRVEVIEHRGNRVVVRSLT